MECRTCGGLVIWIGKLSNLTHTECQNCRAKNNQIIDDEEDIEIESEV